MVWGTTIGCAPDTNGADDEVTVSEAEFIAQEVVDLGLRGMAEWSINRDTDHRLNQGDMYGDLANNIELYEYLFSLHRCTFAQTGEPDGTYTTAISSIING